jgi:hypothetical protein
VGKKYAGILFKVHKEKLIVDKDSYIERFLALLPCTCVLQLEWVHLYQTSSLLPYLKDNYLYLKLAKTLCLSYYLYVFSSTKLEKRAEQVLSRSEGGGGRDGPNNVCTYE